MIPFVASPVLALPPGADSVVGTLVGIDLTRSQSLPITIMAGRLPAPSSLDEVAVTPGYLSQIQVDSGRPQAVLGQEIAFANLLEDPKGGNFIRNRWFRTVVVGVVAQQMTSGDFLVPIEQTRLARQWTLANVAASDRAQQTSPYTGAMVLATSVSRVHDVRAEIMSQGYATSAPEHLLASVQQYLVVVNVVLGAVGSVGLVVALLSIANALLGAVHERRRDIGVLKAIGGRDSDVLRWFLIEALGIGFIGGATGALLGVAVAELVGLAMNHDLAALGVNRLDVVGVPIAIPLVGWLGTAFLAMLAGTLPAMRAARLRVQEAVVEA